MSYHGATAELIVADVWRQGAQDSAIRGLEFLVEREKPGFGVSARSTRWAASADTPSCPSGLRVHAENSGSRGGGCYEVMRVFQA